MKKVLISVLLAGISSAVMAQDAGSMYGIVGYGVSKVKSSFEDATVTSGSLSYTQTADNKGNGFLGGLGYNIDKNLAVELMYHDISGFNYNQDLTASNAVIDGDTWNGSIGYKQKVSATAFSLTGKYGIDVAQDLRLYGRAGLARVEVKNQWTVAGSGTVNGNSLSGGIAGTYKDTSTVPVVGAGIEYAFNKSVSLRGEYTYMSDVGNKATTGESSVKTYNIQTVFKF